MWYKGEHEERAIERMLLSSTGKLIIWDLKYNRNKWFLEYKERTNERKRLKNRGKG